jgi:hypothetical protein
MVEAVDDAAREHGRTDDFSEMATLAAAESLSGVAGREGPGLFGAAYRADETRAAQHRLAADGPFAVLARDFLARLMRHVLDYYLSRELANHVGVGRRHRSLKDHHDFDRALDRHCHEAAVIAQDYAAEWYSKAKYECGVDRPRAAAFVRYALQKLRRELEVRRTVHA